MFGNENGQGDNTIKSEGSSTSGSSTMELLQAQMKEDSTEHLEDCLSAVLDPALAAPLQVRAQASSSHASTSAAAGSSLSVGEMPAHHTAATSSGTVSNNNTSTQAVPLP